MRLVFLKPANRLQRRRLRNQSNAIRNIISKFPRIVFRIRINVRQWCISNIRPQYLGLSRPPPLPFFPLNCTWLRPEYVSHFLFYICICLLVCFQFSLPSTMSLLHLNLYDFDVHCTIAQRCCTWSTHPENIFSVSIGLAGVSLIYFSPFPSLSCWLDWEIASKIEFAN